jgi:hypothetical protein
VNEGKGQLTETQYDHPDLIPDEMGSAAQREKQRWVWGAREGQMSPNSASALEKWSPYFTSSGQSHHDWLD